MFASVQPIQLLKTVVLFPINSMKTNNKSELCRRKKSEYFFKQREAEYFTQNKSVSDEERKERKRKWEEREKEHIFYKSHW